MIVLFNNCTKRNIKAVTDFLQFGKKIESRCKCCTSVRTNRKTKNNHESKTYEILYQAIKLL